MQVCLCHLTLCCARRSTLLLLTSTLRKPAHPQSWWLKPCKWMHQPPHKTQAIVRTSQRKAMLRQIQCKPMASVRVAVQSTAQRRMKPSRKSCKSWSSIPELRWVCIAAFTSCAKLHTNASIQPDQSCNCLTLCRWLLPYCNMREYYRQFAARGRGL